MLILEVITIFLVAIAMSMAVAHALEFPGKLRLDHKTYATVQTIYYPGFTFGGIGEVLAVVATLILMLSMRHDGVSFWWAFSAFVAIVRYASCLLVHHSANKQTLAEESAIERGWNPILRS